MIELEVNAARYFAQGYKFRCQHAFNGDRSFGERLPRKWFNVMASNAAFERMQQREAEARAEGELKRKRDEAAAVLRAESAAAARRRGGERGRGRAAGAEAPARRAQKPAARRERRGPAARAAVLQQARERRLGDCALDAPAGRNPDGGATPRTRRSSRTATTSGRPRAAAGTPRRLRSAGGPPRPWPRRGAADGRGHARLQAGTTGVAAADRRPGSSCPLPPARTMPFGASGAQSRASFRPCSSSSPPRRRSAQGCARRCATPSTVGGRVQGGERAGRGAQGRGRGGARRRRRAPGRRARAKGRAARPGRRRARRGLDARALPASARCWSAPGRRCTRGWVRRTSAGPVARRVSST